MLDRESKRLGAEGVRLCPPPKKKSLITFEKAHFGHKFGAYTTHSDVLIVKLRFVVHRMLQSCGTDSVSLFLRQDAGGLAP